MRLVVVDASAAVDYVLRSRAGERCEPWITSDEIDLYAPEVCDVEVVSGLRRLMFARKLDAARAEEALETHLGLPIVRMPHESLARNALRLRENFTAADAFYVALAWALEAPLLTTDEPLARATRDLTRLEVLPA